MRTVKDLIEELKKFPKDALCWAYEGDDSGIVIVNEKYFSEINEHSSAEELELFDMMGDFGFIPCGAYESIGTDGDTKIPSWVKKKLSLPASLLEDSFNKGNAIEIPSL